VISAKREETRCKRLNQLIACSAKGERIPQPTDFTRRHVTAA
jgi:hypothetical protein